MTGLESAALYVGLHIFLMMVLKGRVGQVRTSEKILFGDGANERLQRAQRVQGNAVEDVPVTLVGLVAVAALGGAVWLIHLLGAVLFIGRILHAVGLGASAGSSPGRMIGTLLSLLAMLGTAIACIWLAFF